MSRSAWGKLGREYYSWYVEDMDALEKFIIIRNIDVDYRHRLFGYTSTLKYQVDQFTNYRSIDTMLGLCEPDNGICGRCRHHYIWVDQAMIV